MPDTLSVWELLKHKPGYQSENSGIESKLGTQLCVEGDGAVGRAGRRSGENLKDKQG